MQIMDSNLVQMIHKYFILITFTVLLRNNGIFVFAKIESEDEATRQNASELRICEDREDLAQKFELLETKFKLYEEDRIQFFKYFNTITDIMKRHIKLEEENGLLQNTVEAIKNEMNGRFFKFENKSDSLKQIIDGVKSNMTQRVEDRLGIEQILQNILAEIHNQSNKTRTVLEDNLEEINGNIKTLGNDTNEQKEEIAYLKKNFEHLQSEVKSVVGRLDSRSNNTREFLETNFEEVNGNIKLLGNETNEQKEEIANLKKNFEHLQSEVKSVVDRLDNRSNNTREFLESNFEEINGNIKVLVNATKLYGFNYPTFTTCGKAGGEGPTLDMCKEAYYQNWTRNELFYRMQINGVQQWIVPRNSYYRISAFGASGGSGHAGTFLGGKGAKIAGTFQLQMGSVVNIVCGQTGLNGVDSEPGGGGGGTFVYIGNIGGNGLLIAAGGEGGAGEENTRNGYNGQSSEFSTNGDGNSRTGLQVNDGNGYGGIGGTRSTAGAGWKSDGNPMTGQEGGSEGNPGTRSIGGRYKAEAEGGFGGGGSGCYSNGGGGGGGFTGGSSTSSSTRTIWGGGGRGSYNAGFNQMNEAGQNNGDGYVIIRKVWREV